MEDVWDGTYDAREQADVRRGAGRGAALREDGRAAMRGGGAESGHDVVRCRDEGALSGRRRRVQGRRRRVRTE